MTKKYFWAMAIVGAFVAGTMMTGTMADAVKPNQDGDGDGVIEGAIHEIVDILNHEIYGLEEIKDEVRNIEGNVTAIKTETDKIQLMNDLITDIEGNVTSPEFGLEEIKNEVRNIEGNVTAIKTETDKIPMIKSDVGSILSKLNSSAEPLTKFKNFMLQAAAVTDNEQLLTQTFESDGPMIAEICRLQLDDGRLDVKTLSDNVVYFLSLDSLAGCVSFGLNPGESISVMLFADAGLLDADFTRASVTLRTTPSATFNISAPVIVNT